MCTKYKKNLYRLSMATLALILSMPHAHSETVNDSKSIRIGPGQNVNCEMTMKGHFRRKYKNIPPNTSVDIAVSAKLRPLLDSHPWSGLGWYNLEAGSTMTLSMLGEDIEFAIDRIQTVIRENDSHDSYVILSSNSDASPPFKSIGGVDQTRLPSISMSSSPPFGDVWDNDSFPFDESHFSLMVVNFIVLTDPESPAGKTNSITIDRQENSPFTTFECVKHETQQSMVNLLKRGSSLRRDGLSGEKKGSRTIANLPADFHGDWRVQGSQNTFTFSSNGTYFVNSPEVQFTISSDGSLLTISGIDYNRQSGSDSSLKGVWQTANTTEEINFRADQSYNIYFPQGGENYFGSYVGANGALQFSEVRAIVSVTGSTVIFDPPYEENYSYTYQFNEAKTKLTISDIDGNTIVYDKL